MTSEQTSLQGSHRSSYDGVLIACTLLLTAIGLASIYSATYDTGVSLYFHRQLMWALLGVVGMTVMLFVSPRSIEMFAVIIHIAILGVLMVVPFFGKTVAGTTAWLELGPFSFQPSEIAKITTILVLALYLSKHKTTIKSYKTLIVAGLIVAFPMGLVLMQADVGTSLIFFLMYIPVVYWAGASPFVVLILIAPFFIGLAALIGTTALLIALGVLLIALMLLRENGFLKAVVFGMNSAIAVSVQFFYERLAPHQQNRISNFIDPGSDPLGVGYNVIQSKVAIGSGGLTGKGFLNGTQTQLNFIPAQWTDFIFCVPGEEFGFIGAAIVLLLLGIIFLRGIRIAAIVKNKFASLVTIGFIGILFFHTIINVGMTIGLTPVIGIPLPFLSYGGSALFSKMIMIGMLSAFYANRKEYLS
jgi:rod shape determining protein RodA